MKLSILALAVLLAGCTPVAPSTTPQPASPQPSFTCSPSGGTPKPCTQDELDKTEAQNKLAAEAEVVYKAHFAEDVRILRAGGVTKATAEMRRVLAEDALADSLSLYQRYARDKVRFVGGKIELKTLVPNWTSTQSGSTIMLQACRNATSADIYRNGRRHSSGQIVGERAYMRPVDGQLKIIAFASREQKSC